MIFCWEGSNVSLNITLKIDKGSILFNSKIYNIWHFFLRWRENVLPKRQVLIIFNLAAETERCKSDLMKGEIKRVEMNENIRILKLFHSISKFKLPKLKYYETCPIFVSKMETDLQN